MDVHNIGQDNLSNQIAHGFRKTKISSSCPAYYQYLYSFYLQGIRRSINLQCPSFMSK
jgi:hypothetical protein